MVLLLLRLKHWMMILPHGSVASFYGACYGWGLPSGGSKLLFQPSMLASTLVQCKAGGQAALPPPGHLERVCRACSLVCSCIYNAGAVRHVMEIDKWLNCIQPVLVHDEQL